MRYTKVGERLATFFAPGGQPYNMLTQASQSGDTITIVMPGCGTAPTAIDLILRLHQIHPNKQFKVVLFDPHKSYIDAAKKIINDKRCPHINISFHFFTANLAQAMEHIGIQAAVRDGINIIYFEHPLSSWLMSGVSGGFFDINAFNPKGFRVQAFKYLEQQLRNNQKIIILSTHHQRTENRFFPTVIGQLFQGRTTTVSVSHRLPGLDTLCYSAGQGANHIQITQAQPSAQIVDKRKAEEMQQDLANADFIKRSFAILSFLLVVSSAPHSNRFFNLIDFLALMIPICWGLFSEYGADKNASFYNLVGALIATTVVNTVSNMIEAPEDNLLGNGFVSQLLRPFLGQI